MEIDFNTVLAGSFGLWAGVVAWGVRRISGQLDTIGTELKTESEKLNSYIVQTERRLAVLEDRVENQCDP